MMVSSESQFMVSVSKDIYVSKQQTSAAIISGEEGRKARKECGLKAKTLFQSTDSNSFFTLGFVS